MEDPYLRSYTRDPPHPHHHAPHGFHDRTTSFFIAVPFVVCFSLFGLLNLVGGTVLTVMSCKPKFSPKALASLQRLVKNFKIEPLHIDPMRVVGIMLLVTGSLLVLIGLALGVTACRSISEHKRKRRRQLMSSLPLYSLVDRRRTSASLTSSPSFVVAGHGRRSNGKKRSLEKTVSPILEASGEYESLECERLAVEVHHASNTSVRDISPSVSAEPVCVSTEAVCQTDFAPGTDCQTRLSAKTVYQTSLASETDCQTGLLTEVTCHTSLSKEAVCQGGLPTEAVGPEDVMIDSGGQANLLANAVLRVDSLAEDPCRSKLSFPRSRFKRNSDKIFQCESPASVELTVVDAEHEMANFTAENDTGL